MTAKVTWGHGVLNAILARRLGRMCFVPNDWWVKDDTPAYPGFDSTSNTIAANTDFTAALLKWLTGKTTGASILIVSVDPVVSGDRFGTVWQAAVAGLGHSTTITGSSSSFNGYDPLDFDCVCLIDTYNPPNAFGIAFDAYIDAGGSAISFCLPGNHIDQRYGVAPTSDSPFYQTYVYGPDSLMTFPSLPFDGDPHTLLLWWAPKVMLVTGSRGGTMTLHNNEYGEPGMATWVA